ncbi:transporter, partial [Elstera litoralis]
MFWAIVLALVPVMLLIGLGKLLRDHVFTAEVFWRETERLGYYLLLPALIVHSLATANWGTAPVGRLMAVLVLSTLLIALLLVALRRWMPLGDAAFTSVFQGGIRFNNYVGLPAAAALYGAEGLALGALAAAAIVPTVNIICVLMFARYGAARPNLRGILLQLAKNPLLLASGLGIALNLTHLGLPPGLEPALKALGQASLPIGLLC